MSGPKITGSEAKELLEWMETYRVDIRSPLAPEDDDPDSDPHDTDPHDELWVVTSYQPGEHFSTGLGEATTLVDAVRYCRADHELELRSRFSRTKEAR